MLFWGNLHISLVYNDVYEMLSSYLVLWGESNENSHSFMLSHIYLHMVLLLEMTAHALVFYGSWGFRFYVGLGDLNEMYYDVISVISFMVYMYICHASLIHKDT